MKFSIVITTYNRVDFLKRAIASALNQTIACEIIVVDNASTDGTQDYVKGLGDRVRYHRNPTNAHHAGAVNEGVRIATGDWIKFVDDDDYLADNCLETLAAAIARHPQAVICSCQAIQVDTQEQESSRTPETGPGSAFFIPQTAIHYGMLLEQVPFGTPIQVAVQREAFMAAGGWDRTMTSCVEIDAWIRISEYGDAIFVNQPLAYRTIWPGGYDHRINLTNRRDVNFTIKERIYKRISSQYRDRVPALPVMRNYLNLHWGLVALKQKKLGTAVTLCFPATFSPQAWQLLRQARAMRKRGFEPSPIPKTAINMP
ncbi:MAG: glycosyltransferase family 2 protein [Cyanobacteria bacterium J06626_18]